MSIYLDIDSQHRNRLQFSNPYDFTISFSEEKDNDTLQKSINPISNAYPLKEWSWNSTPNIQIITSGGGTLYTNSYSNYSEFGAMLVQSASNNIPYQYRVDNSSDGTGLTFQIITRPVVSSGQLSEGQLKIMTYGSGYIPGETLKIHRTDLLSITDATLATNTGAENVPFGLVPVLMTKGFTKTSGYADMESYTTSGGSGTGMKIQLSIGSYSNDEDIFPMIQYSNASTIYQNATNKTAYSYKEGDILTLLQDGTSGTIKVMLVDIRFRIGESFALDISSIVNKNTITTSENIVYHHANLEPLQTVESTSGVGSGMILATIDDPISQATNVGDILLLNRIAYIFEIGTGYEIGDTIDVRDRDGILHTFTLIEPSNTMSNANNIKTIYDNEIFSETKYTEPLFGIRTIMGNSVISGSDFIQGNNVFDSTLEPSNNINNITYTSIKPLPRRDISSNNVRFEMLSSLKNISGNKVYLHNTRTFGLNLYDDYFNGLIFEDLTSGEQRRIIGYKHQQNMLILENELINSSIQNFWRIQNPSTNTKIFIPNGSDNPKDYINHIYEAIVYTGEINSLDDFINSEDVTISNTTTKQYKLNNKSFDKRIVHQYRTITDYNVENKMITLESPLLGITSHANKYGSSANSVISDARYIHIGSGNYQNSNTDYAHTSLPVYPIELETYGDLSLSPTNTNASGLLVDIIVTDNRIDNISGIEIAQAGSGYETQGFTGSTYTASIPSEYINYSQYSSIAGIVSGGGEEENEEGDTEGCGTWG